MSENIAGNSVIYRGAKVFDQLLMHLLSGMLNSFWVKYLSLQHFVEVCHAFQLIHLFDVVSNFPGFTQINFPLVALQIGIDLFLTALVISSQKLAQQTLEDDFLERSGHHRHDFFVNVQNFLQGNLFYNLSLIYQFINEVSIIYQLELPLVKQVLLLFLLNVLLVLA